MPIEPLIGPVRKTTLLRLNQIIQHRLVTGHQLPQQMRNFKIANGRVQFRVEHEFEVGLTLMGDAANIPWRMLEIEILVEDNETGSEYALQIMFIMSASQKSPNLCNNRMQPATLHSLTTCSLDSCISWCRHD